MSIIKSGFIVGIFTLLSRISGFIRDIFISSTLGAGILSDIFNIAFRLPNFFRRIFAEGAFNAAFIPIYNDKLNDEFSAKKFVSHTYSLLLIVLLGFLIIMELLLPIIMYILAPGFNEDSYEWNLAIELCRISMPYLVFISLVSMFGAILNSHNRYAFAAANPILLNLVIILSLIYLKEYTKSSIHALIWGVFLAGIGQTILMVIVLIKSKLMPELVKPQIDHDVKKLLKNMGPGVIGGGVMQINILIDQALASFLGAGAISFLAYADRLNQLPLALIGTAISIVLLPTLSKQIKQGNKEQVLNTQNRALEIALLLSLPACFALITLSYEIIHVLFERGAFTNNDTIATAEALKYFTLGLPAYVLVKILAPSFFANLDTKTPLKISIICLTFNIIFNLCFIKFFGYITIALATSLSSWLNFILMFRDLNKRKIIKLDKRIKFKVIRILFSCLTMMIILKFTNNYFSLYINSGSNLSKVAILGFEMIIGLTSFGITAYFTKAFEVNEIKLILKKG
ncbi:MAG: murein biosynthesis integral membrane protein MurJ [Alphaproteobacteria bacterium]